MLTELFHTKFTSIWYGITYSFKRIIHAHHSLCISIKKVDRYALKSKSNVVYTFWQKAVSAIYIELILFFLYFKIGSTIHSSTTTATKSNGKNIKKDFYKKEIILKLL
jgi:hypothetical protein